MLRARSRIPITLMRGGTSKGLFLNSRDLPPAGAERDEIILDLMGSPDMSKMQLNGLGGGISSTSKVVVLDTPGGDSKFHVNYLFGQVALDKARIDWSSSCANLATAVGLYWVRHMRGTQSPIAYGSKFYDVEVWQQNMQQHMRISVGLPRDLKKSEYISIPGVPGFAPPIKVGWVKPVYPNSYLLPTGNCVDKLTTASGKQIPSTLICGTNPTVIMYAGDLGLSGTELPSEIPYSVLEPMINELRTLAAEAMQIGLVDGLRICWIAKPADYIASDGSYVESNQIDLLARITTPGRVHHAFTGTGAANLAIASAIPGTLPNQLISNGSTIDNHADLRIGHPAGIMECEADVEFSNGRFKVESAQFFRTAKFLCHGFAEPGEDAYDPLLSISGKEL